MNTKVLVSNVPVNSLKKQNYFKWHLLLFWHPISLDITTEKDCYLFFMNRIPAQKQPQLQHVLIGCLVEIDKASNWSDVFLPIDLFFE